ncbi:MAG: alpha/beta hydrolase [Leptolyngbyaceae cyanobacterium bins.349]|nr:alpha/beta hydrolase [Leptolyngbyaceae cyanobacterium bins.349]
MFSVSATQSMMSRSPISPTMGGEVREFRWNWKGKPLTVAYEVLGEGIPVLLLPALSSVSSRNEMQGLAEHLADRFQVVAVDLPGFGQSDRPNIDYRPALYHGFLRDFVKSVFSQPIVAIAAGHSASYLMQLVQQQPETFTYVALAAPTWRGPLPTMMGDQRWFFKLVRQTISLPILGQILYWLNTSPWFLRWMYGRHVFGDRKHITRQLITQKWRTTQQKGARFASVAFVTGALDPIKNRKEFTDYFQPLPIPTAIVIGEQTPPRSREEMEFVVHFTSVQVYRMPGSLGLHEEYATEFMAGVLPFLRKFLS